MRRMIPQKQAEKIEESNAYFNFADGVATEPLITFSGTDSEYMTITAQYSEDFDNLSIGNGDGEWVLNAIGDYGVVNGLNIYNGDTYPIEAHGVCIANKEILIGVEGETIAKFNAEGVEMGELNIETNAQRDAVLTNNNGGGLRLVPASGKNIVLLNLPTSNPQVAGALWNDNGTLKISAGE